MAVTHNASLRLHCTVVTTRDDITSAGSALSSVHKTFDKSKTLNASSTPAVTKRCVGTFTGTQNFDLTSLTDEQLGSVDASGLKLQAILVNNLSTTDDLTISDGVANAYAINGGDDVVVPPGASVEAYFNDKLDDVDATHKAIDFTPGAGESFQVVMLFG